ncbi:rcc01693 family protein [Xanthobacter sp. V4C-4]
MNGTSPAPRAFPWDAAMGLGLGVLRLPPDAFWRMTPRELAAAGGLSPRPAPALDRTRLRALMERFPDAPAHVAPSGVGDG